MHAANRSSPSNIDLWPSPDARHRFPVAPDAGLEDVDLTGDDENHGVAVVALAEDGLNGLGPVHPPVASETIDLVGLDIGEEHGASRDLADPGIARAERLEVRQQIRIRASKPPIVDASRGAMLRERRTGVSPATLPW